MYCKITIICCALSSLAPFRAYGAFPLSDEINSIRAELAQEQSRRSALSFAEKQDLAAKYQGFGENGDIPERFLPRLTYDVLNLSEGDSQNNVDQWLGIEGLDGVIHRSSMGVDGRDALYMQRAKNATGASYRWGAYHFLRQQGSGGEQAKWFIKTLLHAPHPARVLLVIDAEYLRDSDSPHPTVAQVIDCAQTVQKLTGVYPGIYTGQNFLQGQFKTARYDTSAKDILQKTWLWVARYSDSRTKLIFPDVSEPPWAKWTLWQVGDKDNTSPMLESIRAEINIFKGSSEQLAKFWDAHSWDYSPADNKQQ